MDGDIFNIILALALFVEGFIIKNSKLFKNVNNNAIPVILIITSVVITVISLKDFGVETILTGVCNALVSVGFHQTSKNASKADFVLNVISNFRTNIGKGSVDEDGNAVDLVKDVVHDSEEESEETDSEEDSTDDESDDSNT